MARADEGVCTSKGAMRDGEVKLTGVDCVGGDDLMRNVQRGG